MIHHFRSILPTYRKSESGTSAIEFAMVAPLLILLAAGMFSGGMVFHARDTMATYTKDAARAVSLDYMDKGSAKTYAENAVKDALGLAVTVNITAPSSGSSGDVVVTSRMTKAELQKVTPMGVILPNGLSTKATVKSFAE